MIIYRFVLIGGCQMELRKQLVAQIKVQDLARQLHVNRSVIYQSINGDGSRQIRVLIAKIVHVRPSELWADNPPFKKTLDDALFILEHPGL
jgi:hypothetical protein